MNPRIYHAGTLAVDSSVTLTGTAAAHVGKSLRLNAGDALRLFNGDGFDYQAQIQRAGRDGILITIGARLDPATESPLPVTLLQGICRNQRMDWLIQKSTELGVQRIVPVACERSVARIDARKADRKIVHWQSVAISACEQCGRARLPVIEPPTTTTAACAALPAPATKILLDPDGTQGLEGLLQPGEPVALLIGPEGGLTTNERDAARAAGFLRAQLGPRVLRTETAPIAALSIIQFLIGDLNQRGD